MGSMSLLELRESSFNDLKNKASRLDGDTLYILNMEKDGIHFGILQNI